MDLSSMFTEIASPQQETRSLSTNPLTPVPKSTTCITAEVPKASLTNLGECLWLDFGDERQNEVGTTRSLAFALEAPANGACVVDIERVRFKNGFDLIGMTDPLPQKTARRNLKQLLIGLMEYNESSLLLVLSS
jgi:hypothetical protein